MKFALTIPVVAGAVLFGFSGMGADRPPDQAKSITVAELNKLQVIGWLGQPLGKMVTVEGVVADDSFKRSKGDVGQTLLLIQVVDGKKLPEEYCVFYFLPATREIDEPKAGSRFKYIGYETGGFTGTPAKVFDYMPAYCTTSYHFTRDFVIVRDEMKPRKAIESGGKYTAPPGPPN